MIAAMTWCKVIAAYQMASKMAMITGEERPSFNEANIEAIQEMFTIGIGGYLFICACIVLIIGIVLQQPSGKEIEARKTAPVEKPVSLPKYVIKTLVIMLLFMSVA
jgi:hypothetical protein